MVSVGHTRATYDETVVDSRERSVRTKEEIQVSLVMVVRKQMGLHLDRQAIDSIVSGGSILSGGIVKRSVLGRGVRIHTGAVVEDSIIFDNCDVGFGGVFIEKINDFITFHGVEI